MEFLETKNQLWLAPLAGLTDISFRTICKDWDADVVVSEMVSADGLKYSFEKTASYATFTEQQRPFGIQLFGSDPQIMAEGAEKALSFAPDFFDINMGCPVKKVVKRNAGSAIMKNPDIAVEIVSAVKKVCLAANIPLTVKIRAGWDNSSINAVSFARDIAAAGADAIILHPRTRVQMFSGKSNWKLIEEAVKAVSIPIIGNGDIASVLDAGEMLSQTGCRGVMIGRAATGKPWIFRQIKKYLIDGSCWKPQPEEIMATIEKHLELVIAKRGEVYGIKEMRKHLSAYTKGYKGAPEIRDFINHCTDASLILKRISDLILC